VVANPDKIRHIGQVSESWHLRADDVTGEEGAQS